MDLEKLIFKNYTHTIKSEFKMIIRKKVPYKKPEGKVTTLTFGNRAENHIGNESIGSDKVVEGLNFDEFKNIQKKLGVDKVEIIDLKKLLSSVLNEEEIKNIDDAYLLIIRKGVDLLTSGKTLDIKKELDGCEVDKKYYDARTKKVKNKLARYNYCISDFERLEPNYEEGKGRVYDFKKLENTNNLRAKIGDVFGEKCVNLQGEINMYYDVQKCGIGWHGDKEREIVVGARFGEVMPIAFMWFYKHKAIGEKIILKLNEGDIYAMSAKTVGKDWMSSSKYTLRHSAGCDKYINAK